MKCPTLNSSHRTALRSILAAVIGLGLAIPASAGQPPVATELSRADRPWEFLSSVGQRAGLFGNEAGNFEAWVYPLKILRDFHLNFIGIGHGSALYPP